MPGRKLPIIQRRLPAMSASTKAPPMVNATVDQEAPRLTVVRCTRPKSTAETRTE